MVPLIYFLLTYMVQSLNNPDSIAVTMTDLSGTPITAWTAYDPFLLLVTLSYSGTDCTSTTYTVDSLISDVGSLTTTTSGILPNTLSTNPGSFEVYLNTQGLTTITASITLSDSSTLTGYSPITIHRRKLDIFSTTLPSVIIT